MSTNNENGDGDPRPQGRGQVRIGPEFFAKVKADYADWRWALIREFAQNGMDAPRSKHLDFTVRLEGSDLAPPCRTVLIVSNDGSPMDRDTLVNKLLTLGGSGKNFAAKEGEEGKSGEVNTGGFGVAKSLLYYTHQNYNIATGCLRVEGSGAQYQLSEAGHLAGTCSTVVMDGDQVEALTLAVRRFAALAQWKGQLTLNGEALATDLHKGCRRRDLGWGLVYTNRFTSNLCLVRLNGQPMFTRWTRFSGTVLVELTGKASECLTSNRDALTGKLDSELSDLLTALAVDKRSALREQRAEYKRYRGERQRNEARQPKLAEEGVAALVGGGLRQLQRILGGAAEAGEEGRTDAPPSDAPPETAPPGGPQGGIRLVVVSKEDEPDRTVSLGPEFIVKNTTGLRVPSRFTPGKGFSPHCRELVRAWCGVLLRLHQVCNVAGDFSVGFVFDEESEAECERGPYGLVYHVNPIRLVQDAGSGKPRMEQRLRSAWDDRHWLISTACHEFVHGACNLREHDEDYAGKLTDVTAVAMRCLPLLEKCCQTLPRWVRSPGG